MVELGIVNCSWNQKSVSWSVLFHWPVASVNVSSSGNVGVGPAVKTLVCGPQQRQQGRSQLGSPGHTQSVTINTTTSTWHSTQLLQQHSVSHNICQSGKLMNKLLLNMNYLVEMLLLVSQIINIFVGKSWYETICSWPQTVAIMVAVSGKVIVSYIYSLTDQTMNTARDNLLSR